MQEDKIREAFKKIKEDMDYFFKDLSEIKSSILEIKSEVNVLKGLSNNPTTNTSFQSFNAQPTNQPTQTPTQDLGFKAPKSPNYSFSTGNDGVPTNQPTNQQTNQHPSISTGKFALNENSDELSQIKRVSEILETLDELKKEVRFKFKKLTSQEMLVYSLIYQLDEQGFLVDYKLISQKTNLSEISIRDYIRKIKTKGIPLDKLKTDNKKLILSIPKEFKKMVSLQTIHNLRNL